MKQIYGGSFLLNQRPSNDIFIPAQWTDEQKWIAETVREFCVREIQQPFFKRGRELDAEQDRDEIIALLEKAADLGLCGISIDEAYGGIEQDFNTGLLFGEAIAQGFSFATTIGAQTSIGSLPIVFYGTEAQKKKYLPGIANAKIKSAYCLTEPDAGSDANAGKTKASLNEAGTHYLLNGQKIWITNGGIADLFIVFAKIDDDKNLSAFIVEKDFGGIRLGKEEKKLGIKASSTCQVFFDDCPVPVDNLLYERGKGFHIALNILNTGRIKLAAGGLGGCKFALERSAKYAVARKQFGEPIANFGAIKQKIGEIAIRTYALEAAIYRTGHNIDQTYEAMKTAGKSHPEALRESVREFAIECALLKVRGSEDVAYAVDEAIQIHGGMGYAVETGIEMGYRDARITRIYEGTSEINRLLSVGELMKRGLQTEQIPLKNAFKKLGGQIIGLMIPHAIRRPGLIKRINWLKTLFLLLSAHAGNKMKKALIDEQEIIMQLSDILAYAFLTESAWLRTQQRKQSHSNEDKLNQQAEKMTRLYLYHAIQQCRLLANEIIDSYSQGLERKVLRWFIRRLTPSLKMNPKNTRREIAQAIFEHGGYYW